MNILKMVKILFKFILEQIKCSDENISCVALSIYSLGCNANICYQEQLYDSFPIIDILNISSLLNKKSKLAIQLLNNFAANGLKFINLLIDNNILRLINNIIEINTSNQIKVEIFYLIITIINLGEKEQIVNFVHEKILNFIIDFLETEENEYIRLIIKTFLKLLGDSYNISNYIDHEEILNLTNFYDQDISENAKKIIKLMENNENS